MKISREWLTDYIDLSGLSNEQIADRLTEVGHAVESIEQHGSDSVFEVEFTSNRVDAMSHYGLARELSAALGRPLQWPGIATKTASSSRSVGVRITAPDLCTRFSALPIEGVSVGASSEKLVRRLEAAGLRSINNVVDITNYVMLSLGHPMHAFDLDLLSDQGIEVRHARAGETIRTLDGVSRKLTGDEAIVASGERAVGLGGVMGGADTEIRSTTRNVLLECAWFDPASIRVASRRLGLTTDASYRFERRVDPNDTVATLELAAALLESEAGGTRGQLTDTVVSAVQARRMTLRPALVEQTSAGSVAPDAAVKILESLGMAVSAAAHDGGPLQVEVPTWRGDILEERDLIEEILRFHGFNNVPASLPRVTSGDVRVDAQADLEDRLRDLLSEAGLTETVQYAFGRASRNASFSEEAPLILENALNENIDAMRLSLFPGLLETVALNRSYGTRDGGIFEVGRTYHRRDDAIVERPMAAFVLFGASELSTGRKQPVDFFDVKGIIERVAGRLHLPLGYRQGEVSWLARGRAAEALLGDTVVARFGMADSSVREAFDLRGELGLGELDLTSLGSIGAHFEMQPVPSFPGVPMALAVMHSPAMHYRDLMEAIRRLEVPYLHETGLRDRFVAEGSEDQVKTTLGMWYQAFDRSLTQEEVLAIHRKLAAGIAESLKVQVIVP